MQLMQPEKILETKRLALEPLGEKHAALLYAALQDARIYTYLPADMPSLDAMQARYKRLAGRLSPRGDQAWLNWAIRLQASGEYVGTVQATVTQARTSELAYELGPAFWGHGYAIEACRRVLEVLFVDYAVLEVSAQVDTRNQDSLALLERLGFVRTGMQANADFFKGAPSDEYTYRLRPASGAAERA